MRQGPRVALRLVWTLFVVCGVAGVIFSVLAASPDRREEIATEWATVLAAVALVPPVLIWLWRSRPLSKDPGSVTDEQWISAAEHLAERA
jgi:hypothetical protein